MRITHLGHASVLVEVADRRLLIDPGNYSDDWHSLTDLDAVFVTHQHPDHIDPDHVPALMAANPKARMFVEPQVLEKVDLGEAAGRTDPLPAGGRVDVGGGVRIQAVGGEHAVIHRDIPRIGNIGLVVDAEGEPRLFHPGDALDTVPPGIVDVLATPAYGPWAAMKETIDFVRSVKAGTGFLIHEALLSERGWNLVFGRVGDMSDTRFVDTRDHQPFEV